MRTVLTLLLVFLGACSADHQPALVASDLAITRPMPGMTMSAGYLTLTNNSDDTITITRVSSPNFASVMLHESVVEDGIARMRSLDKIEVRAGTSTIFEPGGKHLMLMRPMELDAPVALQFYDGPTLLLTVTSSEPESTP